MRVCSNQLTLSKFIFQITLIEEMSVLGSILKLQYSIVSDDLRALSVYVYISSNLSKLKDSKFQITIYASKLYISIAHTKIFIVDGKNLAETASLLCFSENFFIYK